MELRTVLSELALVAGFNEAEIDALMQTLWEEQYPDGHVFVREGQTASKSDYAMHIILDGKVLVTVQRPGEAGIGVVRLMEEGDIFGLAGLVDHGPRSATCRSAGPVRTASLSRSAFELLYGSDTPLGAHFQYVVARQLAKDLRMVNRQLKNALNQGMADAAAAGIVTE